MPRPYVFHQRGLDLQEPPRHPGLLVREIVLAHYNQKPTQLARAMRMTHPNICKLTSGDNPISVRTAWELERLGHGSARDWLILQVDYDLEQYRRRRA